MSAKTFADTNIMVYAFSGSDTAKRMKIQELFDGCNLVISTQVLREYIAVMTRKLNQDMDIIKPQVAHITEMSAVIIGEDLELIHRGIEISLRYRYRFYDCLIIAAALRANCKILLSEDMQNGQVIENTLTIVNPFL
jgi:predicted nucleic acid-binding protein